MDKLLAGLIGLLLGVVLAAIFSLLLSLPVLWLWNGLMPVIFGLKAITWFQAWGLLLLSGLLFRASSITTKSKSE